MIVEWFGIKIDYPMFIVTAAAGPARAGCLVGFATQCSVHPLRFVVFLSKKNRTYRVASDAPHLAVHLVPRDRRDLAELFGGATGDDVDKFSLCKWRAGPGGIPIIEGCGSWFVGRVIQRIDTGDHAGFVLDPLDGEASDAVALAFQSVIDIDPGHPA